MTHYYCSGDCAGSSETPGVCMAESCAKKGETLVECNCADGTHAPAAEVATEDAPAGEAAAE